VANFMDPCLSSTDSRGSSTTRESSSISVIAPQVHRGNPLKGRKVRKVFVDEDAGEGECYDGKIYAVFFDDGAAHYHVVCDDAD
jgi:hypothetical protein